MHSSFDAFHGTFNASSRQRSALAYICDIPSWLKLADLKVADLKLADDDAQLADAGYCEGSV
jgi:hypothetical protein